MSNFKKDLISGTFYIGIAKYAGILAQLIITAILARLLTPDDYGVITIAMVFIAFFNVLSDVGIGVAVIQKKDYTKRDLDHLFSLSIYIGLFLASVFFFSSTPISKFYNNPELDNVCKLLSLLVLFTCARIVPMNLLYRDKNFKYIAFTNLSVQIGCGISAVIAALNNWGVYALVLSQVLSSFLLFIIYYLKNEFRFYPRIDISPIKRVFSYSAYNFAGTIFIFFTQNIDKLLVGKFIGARPLGFYEKSYNLVFLPITNITFVITPVLHPLFSELQNNLRELSRKYFKIVELLAYISFPLSVILFFTSRELILMFYGNQWIPAILPFKIMSLSISLLILDTTVGSIYNAANETKRGFYTMLIMSIIMISFISIAIWGWNNIVAVAFAFLFARILATLINFFSLTQGLEGKFKDFFSKIVKPILIGMMLFGILYLTESFIKTEELILSFMIKVIVWALFTLLLIRIIGGFNLIKVAKNQYLNYKESKKT